MNVKRVVLLLFFISLILSLRPNPSYAAGLKDSIVSSDSMIVRIIEGIEYIFTFGTENKIEVLEKHAERKLDLAKEYATESNEDKAQEMLQRYERIKNRLGKIVDKDVTEDVLGKMEERIIIQQKTIEEIKGLVGTNVKNEIVTMQENFVNDAAQWIVEVGGAEGKTEFFEKVETVWAPGTEPGKGVSGTSGVVVEGGEMKFAPGTEGTGSSAPDIQNVVIKNSNSVSAD